MAMVAQMVELLKGYIPTFTIAGKIRDCLGSRVAPASPMSAVFLHRTSIIVDILETEYVGASTEACDIESRVRPRIDIRAKIIRSFLPADAEINVWWRPYTDCF